VSTAEKAQEIVVYSRFPPAGKRGLGSPFAHGTWDLNMAGYMRAANDHVLVMVQIETKEGVQNIDKIAAVDGIGACHST
jgi:4-hydroxy-2-oxoheptanedioate aldolase